MEENEIGKIIVDAALTVHRALGPGLFDTIYSKGVMCGHVTEVIRVS